MKGKTPSLRRSLKSLMEENPVCFANEEEAVVAFNQMLERDCAACGHPLKNHKPFTQEEHLDGAVMRGWVYSCTECPCFGDNLLGLETLRWMSRLGEFGLALLNAMFGFEQKQ